MDDIYIYIVEHRGRKFRYGKLCFLLVAQIVCTQFLPDIVCFECCSHHARIICFFEKESLEFFSMDCHIFFFLCVRRIQKVFPSIAITNIYIFVRTNKNNYVLLMIVHNPMDPLINDPSLLHD